MPKKDSQKENEQEWDHDFADLKSIVEKNADKEELQLE